MYNIVHQIELNHDTCYMQISDSENLIRFYAFGRCKFVAEFSDACEERRMVRDLGFPRHKPKMFNVSSNLRLLDKMVRNYEDCMDEMWSKLEGIAEGIEIGPISLRKYAGNM
jgi:hypothetical protein